MVFGERLTPEERHGGEENQQVRREHLELEGESRDFGKL